MLWTIIVILLALWVFGLVLKIGGVFINLLLLAAAVVLFVKLFSGRAAG